MSEAIAPDKPRRRSALASVIVIIVLVGVVVAVVHRPVIEWWIRRQARARGFELDFAGLSLTSEKVTLRQTTVRLEGVAGVSMRMADVTVELDRFEPRWVQVDDAIVEVTAPLNELNAALDGFAARHADSVKLPLRVEGKFYIGPSSAPSLSLDGKAEASGDGDIRYVGKVEAAKTNLGKIDFHRSDKGLVDVEFSPPTLDQPLVKLSTDLVKQPIEAKVTVMSVKVEDLTRVLGLPSPTGFAGAFVEGNVSVVLADKPAAPHRGTASFLVTGWVPPHPRELDGIVYGGKTKLAATFEVPPDLVEMQITKASVEAGALRLVGGGNVVREGLSARIRLDLSGNVACSELGASAIGSYVQGLLGDVLRTVSRVGVGGNVKMRVTVDARTEALEKAKVDQAVDIGCRLR